jgi:hypothetical protein
LENCLRERVFRSLAGSGCGGWNGAGWTLKTLKAPADQ